MSQGVSAPPDQAAPVAVAPKPKRVGRPTTFNAARAERFLRAFGRGCSLRVAAHAAGLGKSTVLTWVTRGQAAKSGPLAAFATAYARVRDQAEAEMVDVLYEAATVRKDPKSALAWLQARRQRRWGRRAAVDVQGSPKVRMDLDITMFGGETLS